jgi:DNA primase
MSLPPGFLDELRTRVSLGQVIGRRVSWDLRKSNQAKGDLWAPCPFHEERTASFHVEDRKGFYYCFGCHAKGDAISFLRQIDGLDFMEAVEALARDAGMEMPARDPEAKAKADRATRLVEVMEAAMQHFRLQLSTRAGAAARGYLEGRGLDEGTLERFEIGYAPADRQGVLRHLREKGFDAEAIVEAGLCARPDDGGEPYDRFRDRVIFPIRDARGRAIALGGRAMSAEARAKYLNSPETPLFDKGRTLYNLGPAREAAGKGAPLVVAEGYMDVIALVRAGFEAAVAPLGTAVTEDQLRALWRVDPEPVLALDGDRAGLRAAMRLVGVALPLLEPGRSLRFALLPEGLDPDDLLRAEGPDAMRRALDEATPLSAMLWRRETEGARLDTPEGRAALDRSLREAVRSVADRSVRHHYGAEMARLRDELFGPAVPGGRGFRPPRAGARAATRGSALAARDEAGERFWEGIVLAAQLAEDAPGRRLREEAVLCAVLLHPELFEEIEDDLDAVEWGPGSAGLARAVARHRGIREECRGSMPHGALESTLARIQMLPAPALRRPGDLVAARALVRGDVAKLLAEQGLRREVREAVEDLEALVGAEGPAADENMAWRLGQAARALDEAERVLAEDREAFETAANGLAVDREERARARALFDGIDYGRAGKAKRRLPRERVNEAFRDRR